MITVTISSSSKFYDDVRMAKEVFERNGISCYTPNLDYNETLLAIDENTKRKLTLDFLRKIDDSEILFVIARNGYVGVSVTLEVGYAFGKGKQIFSSEPISEPAVRALVSEVRTVHQLVELFLLRSSRVKIQESLS